jgi:hypothetical protein
MSTDKSLADRLRRCFAEQRKGLQDALESGLDHGAYLKACGAVRAWREAESLIDEAMRQRADDADDFEDDE